MKKQHLFIILVVVLLGFVFGIIQYYQALKTEDVSAVTVGTPNPGHSLAQLECSASSLCVDTTNNRVGIGTNNPGYTLDVGSLNTGNTRIHDLIIGNGDGQISSGRTDGSMYVMYSTPGLLNINNGKMVVQAAGNVGIGTTTPGYPLQVSRDSGDTRTSIQVQNTGIGTGYMNGSSGIIFGKFDGTQVRSQSIYYQLTGAGWANSRTTITSYLGDGSTNNTLNVSAGNIGIGTTSPSYTLTVAGTAWVTSGSWSGSDIRWKKNISTLSQSSSLEKVMALNPVNYQWKTDEYPEMKFSTGTQLGFIAQDVEKIIPEVVTTNNEGYKGISYEKIVPVLTSAIQEQEKKIEQLKAIVCLDHPLVEVCK